MQESELGEVAAVYDICGRTCQLPRQKRAERRDLSDPRFPLTPVETQNVFHDWGQQAWQQEGKLRPGNTGSVVLRSIPNGKVIS